jgi:hypothetical protein
MQYKVVESREIVWCPSDDRYILIIKEEDAIIGINWMQGEELDMFKERYNKVDEDFTDYFNAIRHYLVLEDTSEVDQINAAIWAFHEYSVLRDEREYKNNNK